MVGIVIVAHSGQLAEGVRNLAAHMVEDRVSIAAAGGSGDAAQPCGTDVGQVGQAIESVLSAAGVVVLMDLGSALQSAELALEALAPPQRQQVQLCEAPLVEGAVAAAIQAAAGGDIEQVAAAALGALGAKAAQLRAEVPGLGPPGPPVSPTEEILLEVRSRMGLHARPAARFVVRAAQFQADITVRNATRGSGAVSAKSINLVTTLGVRQGDRIAVGAIGADAAAALDALQELVESDFGQSAVPADADSSQPSAAARPGELVGVAASPGVAIGPAALCRSSAPTVSRRHARDSRAEWQRLESALKTSRRQIQALRTRAASRVGEYDAAIFDAHLLFLEDPVLIDQARERLYAQRLTAEAVWQAVVDEMVAVYEALEDPYLRGRGADLTDVRDRVLRVLTGTPPTAPELSRPGILVVADLAPSEVVQLDPEQVLGICAALGGFTSHTAILARSLGIPAVVGAGPEVLGLEDGALVAMDGTKGRVWISPDIVTALQKERDAWLDSRQRSRSATRRPAVTRDGYPVQMRANIRGKIDVRVALDHGATGVGLLRTEFLYLDRTTAPTEDEQVDAYRAIAEPLEGLPLVIRTLDVGGDKDLPYLELELEPESNPFLGQRGIRFCLDRPELLKTQLRALLRASPGHQIKIMFPMVSSVDEVRAAKEVLAQARHELQSALIPIDGAVELGIMVEVPAAVVVADQLAAEVDFFSIGTNDLSQYVMAADRTNARVAPLADGLHPAVLRMIRQTVLAGRAAGIRVALCGELAGEPLAAPLLLGLGVEELSLSPPSIPAVKEVLGRLKMSEAEELAEEALQLDSAAAVRGHVSERLPAAGP